MKSTVGRSVLIIRYEFVLLNNRKKRLVVGCCIHLQLDGMWSKLWKLFCSLAKIPKGCCHFTSVAIAYIYSTHSTNRFILTDSTQFLSVENECGPGTAARAHERPTSSFLGADNDQNTKLLHSRLNSFPTMTTIRYVFAFFRFAHDSILRISVF
jgi:hypothetical protein